MSDKSPAITLLRWLGAAIPGDFLKTTFFLYGISIPRKALRLALHGFYRMEHVYDVLREVKTQYDGRLSILEFGTNEGYAFVKMLYATTYLGMAHRVTVHGFDSFQGMPPPQGRKDLNIITNEEEWIEGQFDGNYRALDEYCARHYSNYVLHPGLFEDTLTQEFLETLRSELPILVWIDCDYYSSARMVMERLLPYLPNGCVVYFDEYEFNYGSRFTGEARIVHEINTGQFGVGIELICETDLSLASKRVYRFVRFENATHYKHLVPPPRDPGRRPTNHSPLP